MSVKYIGGLSGFILSCGILLIQGKKELNLKDNKIKDLENKTVELSRRDDFSKSIISIDSIDSQIPKVLDDIQQSLFLRANNFRLENTTEVNSFEEFKEVLKNKGGFISAHWDGTAETEDKIKEATKATIRCIPFDNPHEAGVCVFSGKPSTERVLFAKAY